MRTDLIVSCAAFPGRDLHREPVTLGLPLAQGCVRDPSYLSLTNQEGEEIPLQAVPTARWPDGSIQWLLLDFQVAGRAVAERKYALHIREAPRASSLHASPLKVLETVDGIVVDTGVARFRMRPGSGFPFSEATFTAKPALHAFDSVLIASSPTGSAWGAWITRVAVEDRGSLRTTVRLDASVGSRRRPLLDVTARVQFFSGSAATRIAITVRNPRRARHRDGFWELGDPGSVYVREVALCLSLPGAAAAVECAAEADSPFETFGTPFQLYQDSSGGEHWRSNTHVNRRNAVPSTFRGYRLSSRAHARQGLRATPAVVVRHESGYAGAAVEHFWQNFPKAIEAHANMLRISLFPRQFGDGHELQGGEQKTHRLTVMFGDDPMTRDAVFWGRMPAIVAAPAEWYCASGAVSDLSPIVTDGDGRYHQLVNAAIEGEHSFERKRELIDEYGWRNFGDIYADHEDVFSKEPSPIVSHYNNQYDAVGGFARQFMRTGDRRWWRLMHDLAAHVVDIDIYHTDGDKAAYNHGLFWHTYHYVAAGRSTHRSYPRAPRVWGGGPANEHNYTTGLRLHWLLTGDAQSREAAIGLARWVIDMDDGRKTILRWLSPTDTGLASATGSPEYHGPGRGAGHSILALLDGHRLTNEPRFLVKAEQLIRRCIHPADDLAALNLLDAERRWSYTAFLQAIGEYLHYKAALGEIDVPYAYAREALLHYARWMAHHEYPYLEKPEILEYPTETWAAQDLRKCDVFLFAARHETGAERDRFVEHARVFFEYAVSTLLQLETRALARPVVLLLAHGQVCRVDRSVPEEPRPPAALAAHFGSPVRFVPQKAVAKKRLARIAALAITLAVGTLACLTIR